MAIVTLNRPPTTAEAIAPVVSDLLDTIRQIKDLRAEREQMDIVMGALGGGGTPQAMRGEILGGLEGLRQRPSGARGLMQTIFEPFDPRVASRDRVMPIERLIADAELRRAFADPLQTRLTESRLKSEKVGRKASKASAEASRARADYWRSAAAGRAAGGEPFTATELNYRKAPIRGYIDRVKAKFSPGWKGAKQKSFIDAWENYKADPATGWDQMSKDQQIQDWRLFLTEMDARKRADHEVKWDPTSTEVVQAGPAWAGGSEATGGPAAAAQGSVLPDGLTFAELTDIATQIDGESRMQLLEIVGKMQEAQKAAAADPARADEAAEWQRRLTEAVRRVRAANGTVR